MFGKMDSTSAWLGYICRFQDEFKPAGSSIKKHRTTKHKHWNGGANKLICIHIWEYINNVMHTNPNNVMHTNPNNVIHTNPNIHSH